MHLLPSCSFPQLIQSCLRTSSLFLPCCNVLLLFKLLYSTPYCHCYVLLHLISFYYYCRIYLQSPTIPPVIFSSLTTTPPLFLCCRVIFLPIPPDRHTQRELHGSIGQAKLKHHSRNQWSHAEQAAGARTGTRAGAGSGSGRIP